MKPLPYFRWYPADAETDELYASLTDRELGFFHRCLNRAWLNDGLPADLDELAKTMRVTRHYLDKIWPKVGKCFILNETFHAKVGVKSTLTTTKQVVHRLTNPRQEKERAHATAKSLANQRKGNANAKQTRFSTDVEKNANASQQARARAESDSVCVGVSLKPEEEETLTRARLRSESPARPATEIVQARFQEWIRPWPRDPAPERSLHAFVFCWSAEEDVAMFACRDRFLASKDAAEGVCQNPEKFLNEQKQNGWKGKWPPARLGPAKANGAQAMLDLVAKRIANGRDPL